MRGRRTAAVAVDETVEADRFGELYRAHYPSIHAYCGRRTDPARVDDAVAETFLVAWRRIDDVPDGREALLWLYGVAHRVVGHQWRSSTRDVRTSGTGSAASAPPRRPDQPSVPSTTTSAGACWRRSSSSSPPTPSRCCSSPGSSSRPLLRPRTADPLATAPRSLLDLDEGLIAPDISDEFIAELQRLRLDKMIELGIDERCHPVIE